MDPMHRSAPRTKALLGSFAQVDSANPVELVERLDAMHLLEFFRAYKQETFAMIGLRPGAQLADVGCGTGEDAARMAEQVGLDGSVVGFDMSEAMLGEARRRHLGSRGNLQFIRASADDLGVEEAKFDAIRADRVLTHVPEPAAALKEMLRVLKPGGRIAVSEPDMPGCWVTNRHHAISDRILRAIAMSCKQPFAAREMYHFFLDAGVVDVQLALRPLAVADPVPVENILRFSATVETMVQEGLLALDEAKLWLSDFQERRDRGRFLAGVTIFIVAGTKPAGQGG